MERAGLIGRDAEVTVVSRFLHRLPEQSGSLLVEGEPGIGKTALWSDAVDRAGADGIVVLKARPAEAEAHSSWSTLGDLVDPVAEDHFERLPAPQRKALEVVLFRTAGSGPLPEPRAVWVAFRSLVMSLASDAAVLLAVDDAQWVDPPSAHAVAYCARRLPPANAGILASARPSTGQSGGLELPPDTEGLDRIVLGPLSEAAVYQLVYRHLGVALSRPALRRIRDTSGGNPLFAIELARAVVASGASAVPGQPLTVPEALRDLVADRVAQLSDDALETLVAVAAAGRPTTGLLHTAGLESGLAQAERAGVLEVLGRRIAFTHPLLASASYDAAPSSLRRSVHARLAAATTTIEERARHLALAATGRDATVAATLDAAVADVVRRGAPDQAAELAALALDLSPTEDPAYWHRKLVLGEQLFRAGETEDATRHLEAVLAGAAPLTQARAARVLAEVAYETGVRKEAVALAERALVLAGDDPALRAAIHTTLSLVLYDDNVASADHARHALGFLEQQAEPDPGALAAALVAAAEADFMVGRGLDREAYERAIALEAMTVPPRVRGRALASVAVNMKYADQLDDAREALLVVWRMAEDEGDESSLPYAMSHLPQLELWAGDWERAEAYARTHLELAERTRQEAQRKQAEFNLGLIAAHRGDIDEARRIGGSLVAAGVEHAEPWSERTGRNLLGFVAFCVSDHAEAVRDFDRALELTNAVGLGEPGLRRSQPTHIESLLAIGQRSRAAELLDDYEARGRALDRTSALGASARCRALMAAADGDNGAALAALAESLAQFQRGGFPFEQARSLLIEGRIRRRAREKRAAKDALEAALALFDRLGARGWAAQTREELGRIGLRPAAPLQLTATERQVAELIGGGMSTREVAQTLFLSAKTVEANLTRIYRKLGIRSRAELGSWMAREAAPQTAGDP